MLMKTTFRLTKNHPLRPPNWRWERSRVVRDRRSKGDFVKETDSLVRAAVKLRIQLDKSKDEYDRADKLEKAGFLGLAYDIWNEPSLAGSSLARHEIEARILASQPIQEIAYRFSLPDEVIETYIKVFFDIQDRIENVGYIVHHVIGPAIYQEDSVKGIEVIWKLFGYATKSVELINYLTVTCQTDINHNKLDVINFLANDSKTTIQRRAALAARMLKTNDFSQERLIEFNLKLEELSKNSSDSPVSGFVANVQSLIQSIPWSSGIKPSSINSEFLLQDNGNLRSEELLKIGFNDNNNLEIDQEFKYPNSENKSKNEDSSKDV